MKMHELFTGPEKWTQGTYARTRTGLSIGPECENAVCWCIEGALHRCYPNAIDAVPILHRLNNRVVADIHVWNDDPTRTFAEVRALLLELDI